MALFLQFEIGGDRYLLETSQVSAVIPLPLLKALPGAPASVVGLINYQGKPVPVVDLSIQATGHVAVDRLSTRLALVRFPTRAGERLLGLVVERATSVVRAAEEAFVKSDVAAAPWLGGVVNTAATNRDAKTGAVTGAALAQRIDVAKLLPADLSAVLFQAVGQEEGV